MTGLFRRGGICWARLAVPTRLRVAVGQREFIKSTRTHDLAIAKLIGSSLLVIWRRKLLALESAPMPIDLLKLADGAPALAGEGFMPLAVAANNSGIGQDDLLRAVSTKRINLFCRVGQVSGYLVAENSLELDDAEAGRSGGYVLPRPADLPGNAIRHTCQGILQVEDGDHFATLILQARQDAVDVLAFAAPDRPGWIFAPDCPVRQKLDQFEVKAADVDAMRKVLLLTVLPERIEHARELERARVVSLVAAGGKNAYKLFSQAVDAYCKSTSGLPASVASAIERGQRKKGLMVFAEFMGDLQLKDIDGDKLREFRDGPLRTLPANANSLPSAYRRSTMKETVRALEVAGFSWPMMTAAAQHDRMLWLCRLFAWLAKGWLHKDPAASLRGESGLTKAERKAATRTSDSDKARTEFTGDELKQIFGQCHFQTGNGSHVKKPSYWYGFEYWLPLLGLYAGLRIREASQLHLADIKTDGSLTYIDINDATEDKSLKNENSKRLVPLHRALINLGFLGYCQRLESLGYSRVFPELTSACSDAGYGKQSGRKMSEMLSALGMARDSKRVFHCLRHNMNNALSRVPMSKLSYGDENLKKIVRFTVMGHKLGGGVNEIHYTDVYLKEADALVNCVEYSLPPIALFDVDFAVKQIQIALDRKKGVRRGQEDLGPLNPK